MGSPFSKSSPMIDNSDRIQKLAQLSGISGDVMLFQSGHELMEKTLMWEIENFIIGNKGETYWLHSLPFEIGDDGDHLKGATWRFDLTCRVFKYCNSIDEEVLECAASLKGRWVKAKDLLYSVKVTIHGSSKKETYESPMKEFGGKCQVFQKEKGSLAKSHLSKSGSLIIELTVKVFSKKPLAFVPAPPASKGNSSSTTSFGAFLTSKQFCDLKIYSSDGKKFDAHKIILCAGSEVFNAMFKSGMTEATTGVAKLDDMPVTAVRYLLSFMYDGNILSFTVNGKKVEGLFRNPRNGMDTSEKNLLTVEEVLHISSKYKLEGILDHINRTFRHVCSEDNAATLLELSKMHSLDCKEYLKDYVKRNPRAIDDFMEL